MIRYILLTLAFLTALTLGAAQGQNVTCPDRPFGDSTNACANTRFVQQNGGGGGGSGTVTSVGLSLPSAIFTVAGTPVTSSGTLTGTFKTQTANQVWAGPTTGAAAAPTFRSLVAADLPLGTNAAPGALQCDGSTTSCSGGVISATGGGGGGSVTSVGLSLPAIFTVTGTPVTSIGTLTGTLATQSANLVWAGPTTGAASAPTFRSLVPADLPVATSAALGAVRPDNSTITISAGVLSAVGGGSGTVTSVGLSVPGSSIFGVTGSPVTSSGTLGLTTTGTSGGIPYFSSSSAVSSSAALTANAPVIGGGAGVAPSSGSRSGNTTTFATTSGTLTSGNCAKFDASGNIVDNGAVCGGGGGGTVNPFIQQGRITIVSNTPVLGAPVSGATSVFWTPNNQGNQISLYDGSSWSTISQTQVSVPLTQSQSCTLNATTTIACTDASQLVVGFKVSGTGIPANTTISSISTNNVVLNNSASLSGTNTITFKAPADTGYDVYGQKVSSALKLFLKARGSILTPNTSTTQDGVETLSTDTTLRWLGAVITAATDGTADWALNGQRRYRVWNHDNRYDLRNAETFGTSATTFTWYKPMGLVTATIDVMAPGGGSGNAIGGTSGGTGGTTSFGSHVSATGGSGGAATGSCTAHGGNGSNGTGSSGDINIPGGGYTGGIPQSCNDGANTIFTAGAGGNGGRGIRTRAYADLGATETVTIGAAGTAASNGRAAPNNGTVRVDEIVQF